jgi:hypothetical protein
MISAVKVIMYWDVTPYTLVSVKHSSANFRIEVYYYYICYYFSHGVTLIPVGTPATVWPIVAATEDR